MTTMATADKMPFTGLTAPLVIIDTYSARKNINPGTASINPALEPASNTNDNDTIDPTISAANTNL